MATFIKDLTHVESYTSFRHKFLYLSNCIYIIDVYNEKIEAETSIVNLATYHLMFPKLVSGPIVRYSDIKEKLSSRIHTLDMVNEGLKTLPSV